MTDKFYNCPDLLLSKSLTMQIAFLNVNGLRNIELGCDVLQTIILGEDRII